MIEPKNRSLRAIWIDLLLYPSHTLPTAAAPVVIAAALAVHARVFAPLPLFVGFLASWLIHVGGVFADNYVLISRHPDLAEHPELLAALKDGSLSLRGLLLATVACFAAAAATGPYLLHAAGPAVVALGAVGMLASLWYAVGGRYSMNALGLTDPVFFIMFGIVAVAGGYYLQAASTGAGAADAWLAPQALPLAAFTAGLPAGALVTNVLLIDEIRDRDFDAAKGWRTGAVRFGIGWTRGEIVALTALSYLLPFWFWLGLGFSAWVLLPLLTVPEAIAVARVVCRSDRLNELRPMTPRAARLALDHSVLLGIGLAVFAS